MYPYGWEASSYENDDFEDALDRDYWADDKFDDPDWDEDDLDDDWDDEDDDY